MLRGPAVSVLMSLRDTERMNLECLRKALSLRFGRKGMTHLHYIQFRNRIQKPQGDLTSLALDIERLGHLAFAEYPADMQDKVEVIRPVRPTVESVPSPAESSRTPSAPPAAPAGSAARYLEEFCDRDYHVSTPERAVTPGLSKAELLEYVQDAQPLFDPTEVALMGNEHMFTELISVVQCTLRVGGA
ncbi:hypothetical protein CBL_08552 [Carabus blaptoides fortunei]